MVNPLPNLSEGPSRSSIVDRLQAIDPTLMPTMRVNGLPLEQNGNLAPGLLPAIPAQQPVPNIPGLPGSPETQPGVDMQAPLLDPNAPLAPADPNAPPPPLDPTQLPEVEMPEDGSIQTLAQMAHHFQVHEDQFLDNLSVEDSEGNRTPMTDVVNAFRANPEAVAVAAQRETLQEEFDARGLEQGNMADEALMRTGNLIQLLAKKLAGTQYSQYDMDRMRAEEPERFNAVTSEQLDVQRTVQEAQVEFARLSGEREAQVTKSQSDFKTSEMKKIARDWPEFTNPVTQPAVQKEIQDYLGTLGFNATEVSGIADHRMYKVIKAAMANANMTAKGQKAIRDARRKGVPVPTAAPTARGDMPNRQAVGKAQQAQVFDRAKRTGKLEDAARAIGGLG